jgi:hypothetical protein
MKNFTIEEEYLRLSNGNITKKSREEVNTSDKYFIIRQVLDFLERDTYNADLHGSNRKYRFTITYPIKKGESVDGYDEKKISMMYCEVRK